MPEFDWIAEMIEFCGCSWQEAERMYQVMNEPNTTMIDEEDER